MSVKLLVLLFWLPVAGFAQGFAGLGGSAEGFAMPTPNPTFQFPKDAGAHPEYKIEWWYITANLKDAQGTDYGLQWTLFRSALAPEDGTGWSTPQLWMGNAAITTPDAHFVTERLARGGIGQAGVTPAPFAAWIDDWLFTDTTLSATGPDFGFDMTLGDLGPTVFHGEGGYSVKSTSGQASYYYSKPFIEISGTLSLPQGDVAVSGQAWLDREWSSQPLASDQTGWDWFSLSFDDGAKLMGFQLRGNDTYTSASWIEPDGTTTAMENGAFQARPLGMADVAGRQVPTSWQVTLPAKSLDVTVRAINDAAWMATSVPYWEGPVVVSGSRQGRGYLEMTGY
tara:strand:+ start:38928 stop:39944 length:1017 start_codon:yes stop_codon:yes gene_type:complete